MPATSVLRARDAATYLYLFVVDGVAYAWSTNRAIAGTEYFDDEREVLPGLLWPRWRHEVRYLEDGQFARHPVTFELDDFSERVSETFRSYDQEAVALVPGVQPSDDLTARTELHGMQVGTEAIGPDGERGWWPCIPGFAHAQEHVGLDYEPDEIASTPVTTGPMLLRGRRCALYRVYRDDDGSWRPWDESDRVWWGSVRSAASVDGRRWSLECDGVESWVYRRLGRLSQQRFVGITAPLLLDDTQGNDETRVAIAFFGYRSSDDALVESYGVDAFTTVLTGTTTADLRAEIVTAIATAGAVVGTDGAFTGTNGFSAGLNSQGEITMKGDADLSPSELYPVMRIAMHWKVWQKIGFEPRLQNELEGEEGGYFHETGGAEMIPWGDDKPGPDYWTGILSTYNRRFPPEEYDDKDNGGATWATKPLYPSGVSVIDPTKPEGQILQVPYKYAPVHHTGQLDRPPASDPDDPTAPYTASGLGTVDRQGLWILRGKRSFDPFEDPFDETAVIRASWSTEGATLAQVGGDPATIVATKFLDPRDYGFDRPRLDLPWVANSTGEEDDGIVAYPALKLGYRDDGAPDWREVVAQRLLLSTGLSGAWTSYDADPDATLPVTTNEPLGGLFIRLDGEIADLGLAVPAEMVRSPFDWEAMGEQLTPLMREVQILLLPGQDTEEVWRGLFGPACWAWSLEGGQYGVLSVPTTIVPQESDTVVTYTQKATSAREVGAHKVPAARTLTPIDEVVFQYRWHPIDRKTQKEARMRSPDPGARYRHDVGGRGSEYTMLALGMRNEYNWRARAAELCRWRAQEHVLLRGYPLQRRTAQDLWPGSRVVLTEPRMARPGGGYGATGAVALVLAVDVDETRHEEGSSVYRVDLLVNQESISGLRYHAPIAQARIDSGVEHWYDSATDRVYVRDDMFGVGNDWLDVRGFVEPGYSNLGGDAQIQIHQWSGASDWDLVSTGTVVGINAVAGACYLQLDGALTGTQRRDDEAVITLRPMPDQDAAWVLAFFSPICAKDGRFDGGASPGYPWH